MLLDLNLLDRHVRIHGSRFLHSAKEQQRLKFAYFLGQTQSREYLNGFSEGPVVIDGVSVTLNGNLLLDSSLHQSIVLLFVLYTQRNGLN